MKLLALPIAILAIASGYLYTQNPLLSGRRTGESHNQYTIFRHNADLDDELFVFASAIGSDFAAYRNHCLRVLTFTNYFLTDEVLQELPDAMELAATAIAYHDVALWTDKELAYLEPSVVQFERNLHENHKEKDVAIIKDIIMAHHKITPFSSNHGAGVGALVNAVRMADWADASMGIVRFGMPASLLEAAYDSIPEAGFHKMLLGMLHRCAPGDMFGKLAILNIFRL